MEILRFNPRGLGGGAVFLGRGVSPQVFGPIWIYNCCCDKQARYLEGFAEQMIQAMSAEERAMIHSDKS